MSYEVFKKLCEDAGVRPREVSKETGVSEAALSSWKRGRYTPKIDKLQAIADFFGVTTEYLLTGKQAPIKTEYGEYHFTEETAKAAQEIFENKELRLLFSSARDADPEDLKTVHNLLLALKRKEHHEE